MEFDASIGAQDIVVRETQMSIGKGPCREGLPAQIKGSMVQIGINADNSLTVFGCTHNPSAY
jgi:hypothetical protein